VYEGIALCSWKENGRDPHTNHFFKTGKSGKKGGIYLVTVKDSSKHVGIADARGHRDF
jgi:hypothetical protein